MVPDREKKNILDRDRSIKNPFFLIPLAGAWHIASTGQSDQPFYPTKLVCNLSQGIIVSRSTKNQLFTDNLSQFFICVHLCSSAVSLTKICNIPSAPIWVCNFIVSMSTSGKEKISSIAIALLTTPSS